jgi:hypothetical protein
MASARSSTGSKRDAERLAREWWRAELIKAAQAG